MHVRSFGSSFVIGWLQAFKYLHLSLLKWLLNLLVSVALTLPIFSLLTAQWGQLGSGSISLDQLTITEWIVLFLENKAYLASWFLASFGYLFFFAMVHLYLTGGIIQLFLKGKWERWRVFAGDCAGSFVSLLFVGFWWLIFSLITVVLPHILLSMTIDDATANASGPTLSFLLTSVHWLIVFLLSSFALRVYDVARIFVCDYRRHKPLTSVIRAIGFVKHHQIQTFGLWLLHILLVLVFMTVYWLIKGQAPGSLWLGAALLAQVALIARSVNQQASFASMVVFMGGRLDPAPQIGSQLSNEVFASDEVESPAQDHSQIDPMDSSDGVGI